MITQSQIDFAAHIAWRATTLPKPYKALEGKVTCITPDNLCMKVDGKDVMITRSRLSLSSDLIVDCSSEGDVLTVLVRG